MQLFIYSALYWLSGIIEESKCFNSHHYLFKVIIEWSPWWISNSPHVYLHTFPKAQIWRNSFRTVPKLKLWLFSITKQTIYHYFSPIRVMVLSSRALEKNIGKARGLQNGRFLASFYNHLNENWRTLLLPLRLFRIILLLFFHPVGQWITGIIILQRGVYVVRWSFFLGAEPAAVSSITGSNGLEWLQWKSKKIGWRPLRPAVTLDEWPFLLSRVTAVLPDPFFKNPSSDLFLNSPPYSERTIYGGFPWSSYPIQNLSLQHQISNGCVQDQI